MRLPTYEKLAVSVSKSSSYRGGERLTIPLVFQLAKDLPEEISTITLVYTLYPVQRIALNPLNNNNAAGDKI